MFLVSFFYLTVMFAGITHKLCDSKEELPFERRVTSQRKSYLSKEELPTLSNRKICRWIAVIIILRRFGSDVKIEKSKLNKFLFHQKKYSVLPELLALKPGLRASRLILLKCPRFFYFFLPNLCKNVNFQGFFDLNNIEQPLQPCYHLRKVPKFPNRFK